MSWYSQLKFDGAEDSERENWEKIAKEGEEKKNETERREANRKETYFNALTSHLTFIFFLSESHFAVADFTSKKCQSRTLDMDKPTTSGYSTWHLAFSVHLNLCTSIVSRDLLIYSLSLSLFSFIDKCKHIFLSTPFAVWWLIKRLQIQVSLLQFDTSFIFSFISLPFLT